MSLILSFLQPADSFIITADTQAFLTVHQGLANAFFDWLTPILRNKMTWIPLYALFFFFAVKKYKVNGLVFVAFALIMVLLTDQFASSIVKPLFERLRPCNDPFLSGQIRPLVHCGSGFSFISAHATNHFALAVYLSYFFNLIRPMKWITPIFIIWAVSISFAQVYVGVHYPLDVLTGAIAGIIIGCLITRIAQMWQLKIK